MKDLLQLEGLPRMRIHESVHLPSERFSIHQMLKECEVESR